MTDDRRRFLTATAALGIGTLALHADDKSKADKKGDEEDVGAAEDLMREHGVLNRILLIYEEGLRRLRRKEDVTPDVFHKPALLVRKFVEDYHEKLEEKFIFPEFEKARKLVDLVKVLRQQHEAGRKVTDVVLRLATGDRFHKEDSRKELAGLHHEVALWLKARGVALLGSDGVSDVRQHAFAGVTTHPMHILTLVAMGMQLLDNLHLEDLAAVCDSRQRWEFLLVVAPLKLVGGTASMVNPIAVF